MTLNSLLAPVRRFLTPPPRPLFLVPNSRFFITILPIDPAATTPQTIAAQIELALETTSPFPVAQLYYGYHWKPGSPNALVYAAYRKRFIPEETELWPDAEIIIPPLAVAAAFPAKPGTARLIETPDSLTLLRWHTHDSVPSEARTVPVPDESQRDALRSQLLKNIPAPETWTDLEALPASNTSKNFTFTLGSREITLPIADTPTLDIRDKEELSTRRRAQKRDLILWRTCLACLAILALLALTHLFTLAANLILNNRSEQIKENTAPVALIEKADQLTRQIERLSSQRLLPLEMLNILRNNRPPHTQLTSARVESPDTIQAGARTTSVTDTDIFRKTLESLPSVQEVTIKDTHIRDGTSTFTLTVKFRPNAIKDEANEPPPAPPEPEPQSQPRATNGNSTAPEDDPLHPPPPPSDQDLQQQTPQPAPDPTQQPIEQPVPVETTTTTTIVTEDAPPPPPETISAPDNITPETPSPTSTEPAPLSNAGEELQLQ